MVFGETNDYIIVNILSQGAAIFSNILNLQEWMINDAIFSIIFFIGHNFLST